MKALDAARRVLELDKEATPGPWLELAESGNYWIGNLDSEETVTETKTGDTEFIKQSNIDFITESRSASPQIAAALIEAVELLSAVKGFGVGSAEDGEEVSVKIDKFLEENK